MGNSYDSILSELCRRIMDSKKQQVDDFALYLDIGKLILLAEQESILNQEGYAELERDLRRKLPEMCDSFSSANLKKMKSFFLAYSFLIHTASELKIGHSKSVKNET